MIEISKVVCITFYCQYIMNLLKVENLKRVFIYLFIYFFERQTVGECCLSQACDTLFNQ